MNFIGNGMHNDSDIVRCITEHAVFRTWSASSACRNLVLRCLRYSLTFGQLMVQKWRHQLFDAHTVFHFLPEWFARLCVLYLNY
jgi:hypothetical protein